MQIGVKQPSYFAAPLQHAGSGFLDDAEIQIAVSIRFSRRIRTKENDLLGLIPLYNLVNDLLNLLLSEHAAKLRIAFRRISANRIFVVILLIGITKHSSIRI